MAKATIIFMLACLGACFREYEERRTEFFFMAHFVVCWFIDINISRRSGCYCKGIICHAKQTRWLLIVCVVLFFAASLKQYAAAAGNTAAGGTSAGGASADRLCTFFFRCRLCWSCILTCLRRDKHALCHDTSLLRAAASSCGDRPWFTRLNLSIL